MKRTMNEEFFTYKNRPLVRSKDTIYYGRMTDPYVVMMQVKTKKTVNGEEVSDLISLQMISTDVTVTPDKMVIKRAEKLVCSRLWTWHLSGWSVWTETAQNK